MEPQSSEKMIGIIESVLIDRFGQPETTQSARGMEYRWDCGSRRRKCTLYGPNPWDDELQVAFGHLKTLYGNALGGLLLSDALKIALLRGPSRFGLYTIEELQCQPEVERAHRRDPDVQFFMDSANVWYYGLKGDVLLVYDSETDELDALGPVSSAFSEVLMQFERAE